MQLTTIPRFRRRYFEPEAAPSEQTVRRGIQRYLEGKPNGIPGKKVGGTYYVDLHLWEAGDDPLVARVLEAQD